MKNLSVTTFIHILFSVAIIILIATFTLFHYWNQDRQKIDEFKRYQLISITFLSRLQLYPSQEELQKLYTELHVKPLSKTEAKRLKQKILDGGETIFRGGSQQLGQVRVFDVEGQRYIYVQRMSYNLLLKDDVPENFFFEIAVTLGVVLTALLLLIYIMVLRKLYPLKKLHRQIQRFAQGDMNVKITYEHDDEIGKIAKSFDDAIKHINHLSTSKNLFMRNLMHELKTPITKGRIVVEMLEGEDTKKVLIRAFERMNELISELAAIERVTTQSFEPNFEYVMFSEVVEESQALLMSDSSCVHTQIEEMALTTDKKLMSLVLKNLMDNGIKYSKDKCVTLRTRNSIIEVTSKGDPLEHPLSYYTEPFSQAEKRSAGFGLGLYIVDTILQKIGYRLGYRHEGEENIFILIPEK